MHYKPNHFYNVSSSSVRPVYRCGLHIVIPSNLVHTHGANIEVYNEFDVFPYDVPSKLQSPFFVSDKINS
jgi:hypothetical protein